MCCFLFLILFEKKEKKTLVADDGHLYTIVDSLTTEYNNTLFKFVMACELLEWRRICVGLFSLFVYICISVGDLIIKRRS